jgi:outer membrane immunogenic protein
MKRAHISFRKISFRKIAVSALLIAAPLSVVHAADMAVKVPPRAVAAVPAYNWTSCYIGGYGGGLWAHKDWTNVTPGGPDGPVGGHNVDGGLFGGQAGCDYQTYSKWVFGIQANFGGVSANGSNVNQLAPAILDETHIHALSAVTARFGYAMDRWLGYLKAGGAWERDSYELKVIATGVDFSTASETRSGYTLGAGVEYAFTNCITGFAEYDYYGFGSRTITFPSAATDYYSIRENKSVLLAGLNLRWNGGACGMTPAAAPVVTKG